MPERPDAILPDGFRRQSRRYGGGRSALTRRRVLSCFHAAAVAVLAFAPASSAEVVSARAFERAYAEGSVAVVVVLDAVDDAPATSLERRRQRVGDLRRAVLDSVPREDLRVLHSYAAVSGFVAIASPSALKALAVHPHVRLVDLAARGGGALTRSVPQIRGDRVHARGLEGDGIVIAVLDTGVDADHPDVRGALVHEECFCLGCCPEDDPDACFRGCCPDGTTRSSGPGSARSLHFHGPHVTGIALSRGRVSGVGTAPGSRLVSVRVLGDDNCGFLADWIAGLDWIVANRPDIRVVNMSLASGLSFEGDCGSQCPEEELCAENMLFAEVIGQLRARGTPVFVASGNGGESRELSSPACVDSAIAVGSVTSGDAVAGSSNSSAGLDLLAPGVAIVSDDANGGTTVRSGTSMATPHVAGLAAVLLAAEPGTPIARLEQVLEETGVPIFDPRNGLTFPRIDALAAMNAITTKGELQRGGGSRGTDCLLEWNFVPPDVAQRGGRSGYCTDGDPLCDSDVASGQCTFFLSLCFNVPDPALGQCAVDEPISRLQVAAPSLAAPTGSIEQENAEVLHHALPSFPIEAPGVCSPAFPVVVPRTGGADGRVDLRLTAHTATRADYDRFSLRCGAP